MSLRQKVRARGVVTVLTLRPDTVSIGDPYLVNGTVFTVKAIDGHTLYLKKARGQ